MRLRICGRRGTMSAGSVINDCSPAVGERSADIIMCIVIAAADAIYCRSRTAVNVFGQLRSIPRISATSLPRPRHRSAGGEGRKSRRDSGFAESVNTKVPLPCWLRCLTVSHPRLLSLWPGRRGRLISLSPLPRLRIDRLARRGDGARRRSGAAAQDRSPCSAGDRA